MTNAQAAGTVDFRAAATDALRYWEKRRLAYNLLLAGIVAVHFAVRLPDSTAVVQIDNLLQLFLLAVGANVAYCWAYVPDVFAQMSGYRDWWRGHRYILLAIGFSFAGVIAHSIAEENILHAMGG